jgi:ATP-dependent RNA helicase SUPV3L1/SUV3
MSAARHPSKKGRSACFFFKTRPNSVRRKAMILKSQDKQFSISNAGEIYFQPDTTNPLPGTPVAKIVKGEALLHPRAQSVLPEGTAEGLAEKFQEWLDKNIEAALEPLFRLVRGEDLTGAAKEIAEKIQASLGIIPRDDIQDLIAKLDEEGRKALRARKVRLGPVLVFLPELNKPVAVKLRALLLSLWMDRSLPAMCPADGMVSLSVADKDVDADYMRRIGYPVFGPRAVRVDMLDRVICAIYDTAKDGQFQAQHKMAEWLGCNIPDLYAVLEAMGHVKVSEPIEKKLADELKDILPGIVETAAAEAVAAPAESEAAETPAAEDAGTPEADSAAAVDATSPEALVATLAGDKSKFAPRPELATFRLKRHHSGKPRAPREPKILWERGKDTPKPFQKDKPQGDRKFGEDKPKFKKKKFDKDRDDRRDDRPERIYTAEPKKKEDSPFAILQQLKMGNDGSK